MCVDTICIQSQSIGLLLFLLSTAEAPIANDIIDEKSKASSASLLDLMVVFN